MYPYMCYGSAIVVRFGFDFLFEERKERKFSAYAQNVAEDPYTSIQELSGLPISRFFIRKSPTPQESGQSPWEVRLTNLNKLG